MSGFGFASITSPSKWLGWQFITNPKSACCPESLPESIGTIGDSPARLDLILN